MSVQVFRPTGTEDGVDAVEPGDYALRAQQPEWDFFRSKEPVPLESWQPPVVELMWRDHYSRKKLKRTDFIGNSFMCMTFTQKVVDVLGDVLTRYGQILPVHCDEMPLYCLNVTRVVDALDWDKCSKDFPDQPFRPDGYNVFEVAFQADKLEGEEIFRLPQPLLYSTYITNKFFARVEAAGLTGLGGRIIFDSDGPLPWQRA